MNRFEIKLISVYGLAGVALNLGLHRFESVEMWTLEHGLSPVLPLAVIGDVLLSWARVLEFVWAVHEFAFALGLIAVMPLILAIHSALVLPLVGVLMSRS